MENDDEQTPQTHLVEETCEDAQSAGYSSLPALSEDQMFSGSQTSDTTSLEMSAVLHSLPEHGHRADFGQQSLTSRAQPPPHAQQYSAMGGHVFPFPYQGPPYNPSGPPAGFTIPFTQQYPLQNFQPPRTYNPYSTVGPNYAAPAYHVVPGPAQHPYPQFARNLSYGHISGTSYHVQTGSPHQQLLSYRTHSGTPSHSSGGSRAPHLSVPAPHVSTSTTLRGPPRKPRQSGHALWVGNLPPGANIIDLKDHFSREATGDIESVFLISKSHCAFVNYKTEEGCTAAMNRFHDSRFHGVRLVCRLRRGNVATSTLAPSSETPEQEDALASTIQSEPTTTISGTGLASTRQTTSEVLDEGQPQKLQERYFIIKSLTIEDLDRSVQSGIWATQSHNEVILNEAYRTALNVYLIFSANKSGEYFGYARMDSAIDGESVTTSEVSLSSLRSNIIPQEMPARDIPLTIPTPATATAPKGHIIDDSARGTIFWEAETPDSEVESDLGSSGRGRDVESVQEDEPSSSEPDTSPKPGQSSSTSFGKPFKIIWLSTEKLPFYRTRGLRNPWNTNREVKIARDGTELEPSIGRRLVSMFGTMNQSPPTRQQHPNQFPMIVGQEHPVSSQPDPVYGRPF